MDTIVSRTRVPSWLDPLPRPIRRSKTKRLAEANQARRDLARYRERADTHNANPLAVLDLFRAQAALERLLWLETGGQMGARYATPLTVARAHGLTIR